MILFAGIPSEPPLARAIAAAARAGAAHAVFNQRDSHVAPLEIEFGPGGPAGRIGLRDRTLELAAVRGVYTRLTDAQTLPELRRSTRRMLDRHAADRAGSAVLALDEWFECSAARIANRSSASASNQSKPFQALAIAACGLAIPETLVTNDPEEAAAFRARHGEVVFKSTSAVRSIVRRLDDAALARLGRIRALPTQFQERIQGVDVRVHVAGQAVFATRIESEAVDYRYAGRDGLEARLEAAGLPDEIAGRCVALSEALGLPFCGIDLRHAEDGRWVCFEANPSPAYSYYEDATGQPIAAALVAWLAAG